MFNIGDNVKVTHNLFSANYNFIIDKIGTIVGIFSEAGIYEVRFDYDEQWANEDWICYEEELELA